MVNTPNMVMLERLGSSKSPRAVGDKERRRHEERRGPDTGEERT